MASREPSAPPERLRSYPPKAAIPHSAAMRIELPSCTIRSFQTADAASLAEHANNRLIWRNLRDLFPHPYRMADAEQYIARMTTADPETGFAIECDGAAVGSIGVRLRDDVDRVAAEFGYWIGEDYWGRGIATESVVAFTQFALEQFQLARLEACVFQWNEASRRVLEKAGYQLDGLLRKSALKDGQLIDRWLYSYVRNPVREAARGAPGIEDHASDPCAAHDVTSDAARH